MSNPFGTPESAAAPFRMLQGLAGKIKGSGSSQQQGMMSRNNMFREAIEAHHHKTAIDVAAQMQLREHGTAMNIKEAQAAAEEGRKTGAAVQYKSDYASMAVGAPAPKPISSPGNPETASPTPSPKAAGSDTSPKPIQAPKEKPKPTGSVWDLEGAQAKPATTKKAPVKSTTKKPTAAGTTKTTKSTTQAPKPVAKKPASGPTTKTTKAGTKAPAATTKAKDAVRGAARARNAAKKGTTK